MPCSLAQSLESPCCSQRMKCKLVCTLLIINLILQDRQLADELLPFLLQLAAHMHLESVPRYSPILQALAAM